MLTPIVADVAEHQIVARLAKTLTYITPNQAHGEHELQPQTQTPLQPQVLRGRGSNLAIRYRLWTKKTATQRNRRGRPPKGAEEERQGGENRDATQLGAV